MIEWIRRNSLIWFAEKNRSSQVIISRYVRHFIKVKMMEKHGGWNSVWTFLDRLIPMISHQNLWKTSRSKCKRSTEIFLEYKRSFEEYLRMLSCQSWIELLELFVRKEWGIVDEGQNRLCFGCFFHYFKDFRSSLVIKSNSAVFSNTFSDYSLHFRSFFFRNEFFNDGWCVQTQHFHRRNYQLKLSIDFSLSKTRINACFFIVQ